MRLDFASPTQDFSHRRGIMEAPPIPGAVIGALSDHLANFYTHAQLDTHFLVCGAPGEPPEGSKVVKASAWLRRVNADLPSQALTILGKLLEEMMDRVAYVPNHGWPRADAERDAKALESKRDHIRKVLGAAQLEYVAGGRILRRGQTAVVARQLADLIRERDMPSLEAEFTRATEEANAHPREALSAAANILEAVLGEIIELLGLQAPNDRTLRNLWKPVKAALKLDPALMPDQDLATVVGAMAATVEGLSGLRNDKSVAHAMRPELARSYRLQPRHARLAINAAYGLTAFLLETVDSRTPKPGA